MMNRAVKMMLMNGGPKSREAHMERSKEHYDSRQERPLDQDIFGKDEAEAWVAHMKNEDPTHPTGGRWTMAQTTSVMKDKGLSYPEAEWYAVMNMLYSDYGPLLAKHGPNELDAYVELAKAWLDDKDAMPGKTARYYYSVVRGM